MNWLDHDHRNFESAVYKCRTACDIADWSLVQDVFAKMASTYRNHIRIEEEVLFPAYDAHPGASSGPTASLEADHEQILHLMDHIAQGIDKNDRESLAENFSLLYRIGERGSPDEFRGISIAQMKCTDESRSRIQISIVPEFNVLDNHQVPVDGRGHSCGHGGSKAQR